MRPAGLTATCRKARRQVFLAETSHCNPEVAFRQPGGLGCPPQINRASSFIAVTAPRAIEVIFMVLHSCGRCLRLLVVADFRRVEEPPMKHSGSDRLRSGRDTFRNGKWASCETVRCSQAARTRCGSAWWPKHPDESHLWRSGRWKAARTDGVWRGHTKHDSTQRCADPCCRGLWAS